MAEIELNVINNHGLSARIPTREQMRKEAKAWNDRRNKEACKINRRFTTADARIKLKRLYPQFESCRDTSDRKRISPQIGCVKTIQITTHECPQQSVESIQRGVA
jgi:hypothetical protein